MSWSTSEIRVRLAPLNRFKPSSKNILLTVPRRYFFCGSLMFLFCLVFAMFVRVCLYVLCGHLLGKGWPLGSRLWCLLWVCHFPIGILGQVWYLIVSIPDLCTLTYFTWVLTYHWIYKMSYGKANKYKAFSNVVFFFFATNSINSIYNTGSQWHILSVI